MLQARIFVIRDFQEGLIGVRVHRRSIKEKDGEIDGEDIQQSFAVDLYGINLPPLMATKPLLDNSFWVVVVRQGAFRE